MTAAKQQKQIAKAIEARMQETETSKRALAKGGNYNSLKNVLNGKNVTLKLLIEIVNKLGGTIEVKFDN